jgi:hypothetical protein
VTHSFVAHGQLSGLVRVRGIGSSSPTGDSHFNVTERRTAKWTGQQMVEAFPEDTAPRYLIRDRDQTYGECECFRNRLKDMGIIEV